MEKGTTKELIKKLKTRGEGSVYHVKTINRGKKDANGLDIDHIKAKIKAKLEFRGMCRASEYNTMLKFTDKEKQLLAKELGVEIEKLNPMNENNVWKDYNVIVDATGLSLELSEPDGLIKYLILKSYKNIVVDGTANIDMNPGAKLVMYPKNEDLTEEVTAADHRYAAMSLVKDIEGDSKKLRDMASVYLFLNERGKKLGTEHTTEYVKKYLTKVADKNPQIFLKTFSGSSYDLQLFLMKALDSRAVVRKNSAYYPAWSEDVPLAYSQDQMLVFIGDIVKNSDAIKRIEEIVEDHEKKSKI